MRYRQSLERRVAQQLHKIVNREYIALTGRGAAGIWATLRAWDLRNRVILLPSNTCYIVLWAVLKSGNIPFLVDVDVRTANLSVDQLANSLIASPAVVVPCHMYGLAAPIQAISQWAQEHGIRVIEDAALALGATANERPAGMWGDASILSFGLGKIIDNQVGGALLTDDANLAREVRRLLRDAPPWNNDLMALTNQWNDIYWSLHQHEQQNPRLPALYPQLFDIFGSLTAYRLSPDDWSDVPGLLHQLPKNLEYRAHLTTIYDEQFKVITRDSASTLLPNLIRPEGSVLWRYPLLVHPEIRDHLLAYLWENGIHEVTRWYPPLWPMQNALIPHVVEPETPVANRLGASIINLPVDMHTTVAHANQIADLIVKFLDANPVCNTTSDSN